MGIPPLSLKHLFGESRILRRIKIGNTEGPDTTSPNLREGKSFFNNLNQLHSLAGESETHKCLETRPMLQGSWAAELGMRSEQGSRSR